MTLLRKLRWVPAAAIAAAAGVMLATYSQPDRLPELGQPTAAMATPSEAQPKPPPNREGDQAQTPDSGAGHGAQPPGREDASPDDDIAQTLERLRETLLARAATDPEGALAALMALDPDQRAVLAEEVIRVAAATVPELTLAWLSRNVTDAAEREQLLVAAYAGLAEQDPAFAMNATTAIHDAEARRLAQHQVLETWSEVDVAAAYEWARGQTGEGSGDMYATVMQAYMEQSPEQAGSLIASLPEGEERSRMIDHYVHGLAVRDPSRALDWLAQFDDETQQHQARSIIVDQWAEHDPWEALEYATTQVEGEEAARLVERIVGQASADQPEEVARSLHRLPQQYHTLAAGRLTRSWAYVDARAARAWADTLPEGEARAAALQALQQVAQLQDQTPSQ